MLRKMLCYRYGGAYFDRDILFQRNLLDVYPGEFISTHLVKEELDSRIELWLD